MYCILWVIFQTLAFVVEGGVSSGSAEALLKGAAKNNGGGGAATAGNAANAGAQNGVPLAGGAIVARLVQIGGSLFIQPVGNPAGQAPVQQQLIPITALQQGGTLLVGQAGAGANGNPQGPVAQPAGGGSVILVPVVPQNNAGVDPQLGMLNPGQLQLIPVAGPNNQQQLGGGNGGRGLRFQRSVTARLRRTPSPTMKAVAAEEEEECSGMDTEESN